MGISLITYYGWHFKLVVDRILNIHPDFLISNSPTGPYNSGTAPSVWASKGIKFFEYLDGGFEFHPGYQSGWNNIASNLAYIQAASNAGAYGIFLDQVSNGGSAAPWQPDYNYLAQIWNKAHGLGLKVIFNTGMDTWADELMNYCDFVNGSENFAGYISPAMTKWAGRVCLLTTGITGAQAAANLTNIAEKAGIYYHYACYSAMYDADDNTLPDWLEAYNNLVIGPPLPTPAPTLTIKKSGISKWGLLAVIGIALGYVLSKKKK